MKKADKGYKLPDDTSAEDCVCIRAYVPDKPEYIAAFWGSYEYLTAWKAWEKDAAHRGKDAAGVWKPLFQRAREEWECSEGDCGVMDTRQSESTPCVLEKQTECDGTWSAFADMRLCVPRMRFVGGVLQQDTTGLGDWVDAGDPEAPYDDRTDGAYTPAWATPPEGEDGACLAALNAIAFARSAVTGYCNLNDTLFDFLTNVMWFISRLQVIAEIKNIVVQMVATFVSLIDGFLGDWGDTADYDFTDDILCIIKDAYQTDGSMTGAGWATIGTAIQGVIDGKTVIEEKQALRVASLVFFGLGPIGMSRVANFAGILTGTCDCGWHVVMDLTSDDYDWERVPGWTLGEYSGGWGDTQDISGGESRRGIFIRKVFSGAFSATKVVFRYNYSRGSVAGDPYYFLYADNASTALFNHPASYIPDGTGIEETWEGTMEITTLRLQILAGYGSAPDDPGGSCLLTKVEMWGTGTPPEL
jgi:hypothetical protein